MKLRNKILLTIVSSALCASVYSADYGRMFIFGDSLSDVGNTRNTQSYNYAGRWTNGMVWHEYLAETLGMDAPTKSKDYISGETPDVGHTNFAYGGAMTSHGTTEFVIPSISQQINDRNFGQQENVGFERYGANFNADDLILIWGGANNLFFFRTDCHI